jgi:hypothetical protein
MIESFGLVDRDGWAPGPWDGEPDEAVWRSVNGLGCLAKRSPDIGCWCGYVEVPSDHPWFGLDGDALPYIDVHGGVTFTGSFAETWWIGFDCGHYDDVMPGIDALLVKIGARELTGLEGVFGSYKPLAYVHGMCALLARQIAVPLN